CGRVKRQGRRSPKATPPSLFRHLAGPTNPLRVAVGDCDGNVVSRGVLVVVLDAGSGDLNPLDNLLVVTESPYTGGCQLAHVELDRDRSTRDDDRRVASCFWHKFSPRLMRLMWCKRLRGEPTSRV